VATSAPGAPVVQLAKENMELAESNDVPIIDRKDASDCSGNSHSQDIPSKSYVIPISFLLCTYLF
jgi:hypothetical protein